MICFECGAVHRESGREQMLPAGQAPQGDVFQL